MTAQIVQLLCGQVNLYEKMPDGTEVLRPHRLQVREGVCAHELQKYHPEEWQGRTADIPGNYIGTVGPDRDDHWPVHTWVIGSFHDQSPPPRLQDLTPESPERAEARRVALDAMAGYVPEMPPPAPMSPDAFSRIQKEEEKEHPAPEHTSGDQFPEEFKIPVPIRKLRDVAMAAGWFSGVTYARGNGVHAAHGKPTALAHSLAVRIWGHRDSERRAVAVYVKAVSGGTWAWKTVYVWGPDLAPLKLGREILDEFLQDPCGSEEKLKEWVRERSHAVEAKKVKDKAARADGSAKRTTRQSGG